MPSMKSTVGKMSITFSIHCDFVHLNLFSLTFALHSLQVLPELDQHWKSVLGIGLAIGVEGGSLLKSPIRLHLIFSLSR